MELNKVIFPAPTPSYSSQSIDKLLWIPRSRYFSMKAVVKGLDTFENAFTESRTLSEPDKNIKSSQVQIPCLYHTYLEPTKNVILYFHGNAEDIGYASEFTRRLSTGLKANVIAVEYPGYGVYKGDTSSTAILEDAEIVYDFLVNEVGVKPQNIFVFGRSIGSGPATHLASHRKPGMLILMSPYTSIKNVVKDIAGTFGSYFVADRFQNIDLIDKVKCPCFFVHGKMDKLIHYEHSKELFSKCKCLAAMNISETMTHNHFSLSNDIIRPLRKFFRQLDIKSEVGEIEFPRYVWKTSSQNKKRSVSTIVTIQQQYKDYKLDKRKKSGSNIFGMQKAY